MSMLLNATTKSIEVVLGGAVQATQLPITAHFVDHTTTAVTPGSTDTVTNGATPVTAVAAPAASTTRQVMAISIFNDDSQITRVVVQLNNNGTTRKLYAVDLLPQETFYFDAVAGAYITDSFGALKFQDGFQRAGILLALSHVGGASGVAANMPAGAVSALTGTTLTLANNNFFALPFIAPPRGGILNRIGVYVSTGVASCEVRLGVYDSVSETNLYPNALLFDSGVLSIATSSVAAAAAMSLQLVPGKLYWAVLNANVPSGSPIIRALAVGGCAAIFGVDDTLSPTALQIGLGGTRTYAALPATFPASVAALTTVPPAISVRFSA